MFIHHNTLHAFEHLPFEHAVVEAGRMLGCEPFLSEQRYREELARGRISARDVSAVLEDELGARGSASVAGITSRVALWRRIALYGIPAASGVALDWLLSESRALERFRQDLPGDAREVIAAHGTALGGGEEAALVRALWQGCVRAVARAAPAPRTAGGRRLRHRDLLLDHIGVDIDDWVHPVLIRFASAYLDQGLAHRAMPDRKLGFYRAFLELYGSRWARLSGVWARKLPELIGRERERGFDACSSLEHSLAVLGVAEAEWPDFLAETALALRGFAGMMHQVEMRPDRVPANPVPARLADFLAVRLLLERVALAHVADEHPELCRPMGELRDWMRSQQAGATISMDSEAERAWPIFHVAQLLGLSTAVIEQLQPEQISELEIELTEFDSIARRRVLHLAYERHLRRRYYDALVQHTPPEPPRAPGFQAIFCIDEREESFRRHLEEAEPGVETAGTAGFFGIPMYYRGATDARPRPLCPVVIRPAHYVGEAGRSANGLEARWLRWQRRGSGLVGEAVHHGSRTLVRGAVVTALVGVLAVIPLVLRVLVPWLGKWLARPRNVLFPGQTQLELERTEAVPPVGQYAGFTIDEMSTVVERLLVDTGISERVAPLVFVIGHGSTSLNNPHGSAYDCGACGGSPGGPNARAFAQMANDPRVRAVLASRGLLIPSTTWFVGAQRNTASNALDVFDIERVPTTLRAQLERAQTAFERARATEAHERCRRFEHAPSWLPPRAALIHVEARSADLAQPRPECGHATNALCVVGRRSRTRGLFLDRRAFLVSYDPTRDPEARILARSLAAVVPVVAGISLEYYFSYVDPEGYGCGTKLPHNVTSLLGVMNGPESDLRTGLPWQMVEIHEPVRLSLIVECTRDAITSVLQENPALGRLVDNRWLFLACLDPDSNQLWERSGNAWLAHQPEHPLASVKGGSSAWYRGNRGHLLPARIECSEEGRA